MTKIIILFVVVGIIFYFLYNNGLLVVNAKRASMYIGSMKGNRAKFAQCSGYIKRVIRFEETRAHRFNFDCNLTAGTVSVEILDSFKNQVLALNGALQSATADIEKGKRYYLVFHFKAASGSYVFKWD